MNFPKAAFITVFSAATGVIGLYALVQMINVSGPVAAWLGLTLSALTPLACHLSTFVTGPPRAGRPPLIYSVLTGLGLAVTMAMSWRYGPAAGTAHLWAGLSLLLWLVYLRWYRRSR
jgi:hypothetical protein